MDSLPTTSINGNSCLHTVKRVTQILGVATGKNFEWRAFLPRLWIYPKARERPTPKFSEAVASCGRRSGRIKTNVPWSESTKG
jgi:hypothetical protein